MKRFQALLFCLILGHFVYTAPALAEEAQDAYDPFIDYNEFESADEEEADINFFQNGRMLTMGFLIGQRGFTEGLSEVFDNDMAFGLYLSYFFDMRFALQFGHVRGSHAFHVSSTDNSVKATGDVAINTTSVHFKYFLNTQNVTKGLATLNPYVIAGFSSNAREISVDGQPDLGKDDAMGFDAGLGIEFPMLRNKMYFGAQGMYSIVNFKDENSQLLLSDGAGGFKNTNKYPNGDVYTVLGIIGVNF